MRLAASASPVARPAGAAHRALQAGDAGGVFALEFGEARAVEGFFFGALGAGFLDGVVGEEGEGEEDGCHFFFGFWVFFLDCFFDCGCGCGCGWREKVADGVQRLGICSVIGIFFD